LGNIKATKIIPRTSSEDQGVLLGLIVSNTQYVKNLSGGVVDAIDSPSRILSGFLSERLQPLGVSLSGTDLPEELKFMHLEILRLTLTSLIKRNVCVARDQSGRHSCGLVY